MRLSLSTNKWHVLRALNVPHVLPSCLCLQTPCWMVGWSPIKSALLCSKTHQTLNFYLHVYPDSYWLTDKSSCTDSSLLNTINWVLILLKSLSESSKEISYHSYSHIFLYCLPSKLIIQLKSVITFRSLHVQAPTYICNTLHLLSAALRWWWL